VQPQAAVLRPDGETVRARRIRRRRRSSSSVDDAAPAGVEGQRRDPGLGAAGPGEAAAELSQGEDGRRIVLSSRGDRGAVGGPAWLKERERREREREKRERRGV